MASVIALLLAACGGAAVHPTGHARLAADPSPVMQMANSAPGDPRRQAGELRTSLEELLGQHVFVGVRVIRSRLRGDPDFTQAAVNALSRNTGDLTALVTRFYGAGRGQQFRPLWEAHETWLVSYARAASQHDEAGKATARRQLAADPMRIGQLLQATTSGAVSASVVAAGLRTYVADILRFADAYVAADYATAYRIEREAYERLFGLGKTIAAGVAAGPGGRAPADFDSPLRHLQSALGELLGEHLQLAVDAMGAALRGGPEFRADAAQVNADTQQLAGAFGVMFGPQSGIRFAGTWGEHVDALISYAGSVAAKDQQRKSKALARLRAFEQHLGAFLSTSTQGRLGAPALSEALRMHDRELVGQLDAYASGDYATMHRLTYEGYQHMFAVAKVLATAIGPTIAARLPAGGVQTGGGGAARSR